MEQNGTGGAISILGIPFDRVNVAATIARIEEMIAARTPHYLVTANVDFLVQARADIELRRILLDAHLVLCDGTPLLWASRLLGNALPERVAGSDLAPLLLEVAAKKSYKVFLLGAAPESARKAMERLRARHPNILIDHYSPPFHRLLEMDHDEIRRRILTARPDILLVSFGCPKQEKWIAMHYRELGVPVSIGVGATIDFLAGLVRRAPVWMQRSGTEWVYRLLQEPRRLAGRYSKDLWVFGTTFLTQCTVLRRDGRMNGNGHPNESSTLAPIPEAAGWQVLRLPNNFNKHTVPAAGLFEVAGRYCVLDASGVVRIDSTALAMLVRWQGTVRTAGGALVLLAPSPAFRRALDFARLQSFFHIANDFIELQKILQDRDRETACVTETLQGGELKICWRGEVMAGNAARFWEPTAECLEKHCAPGAVGRIELDMSGVPFLDSTGLGLLIRIRKSAEKLGFELSVTGLQPAVLNVIRLAQLHSLITGATAASNRRRWVPRKIHSPARRTA